MRKSHDMKVTNTELTVFYLGTIFRHLPNQVVYLKMVSLFAFYSINLSSSPVKVNIISVNLMLKRTKINKKRPIC